MYRKPVSTNPNKQESRGYGHNVDTIVVILCNSSADNVSAYKGGLIYKVYYDLGQTFRSQNVTELNIYSIDTVMFCSSDILECNVDQKSAFLNKWPWNTHAHTYLLVVSRKVFVVICFFAFRVLEKRNGCLEINRI